MNPRLGTPPSTPRDTLPLSLRHVRACVCVCAHFHDLLVLIYNQNTLQLQCFTLPECVVSHHCMHFRCLQFHRLSWSQSCDLPPAPPPLRGEVVVGPSTTPLPRFRRERSSARLRPPPPPLRGKGRGESRVGWCLVTPFPPLAEGNLESDANPIVHKRHYHV